MGRAHLTSQHLDEFPANDGEPTPRSSRAARAVFDQCLRPLLLEERRLPARDAAFLGRPDLDTTVEQLWRSELGWTCRWLADRVASANPGAAAPHVLDVACGAGTFATLFAKLGATVTALEVWPEMLALARGRQARSADAAAASAVSLRRASLSHEFRESCDLIWMYQCLSRIDPLEYFFKMARERLRPAGVLVIGVANGGFQQQASHANSELSPYHEVFIDSNGMRRGHALRQVITRHDLERLLNRNGFHVVRHALVEGLHGLADPVVRHGVGPTLRMLGLDRNAPGHQSVVAVPR
jgi:SAM-dependent methyltransferase